ncbi:hypothetical protein GCM10027293_04390 [Pontibacter aydingkolensis]
MSQTNQHTTLKPITVVAKTDCYELLFNAETNRIYFTILGFWKNGDVVPDLLSDLNKALAITQKGFTLLADLSAMVTHPQQLNSLHIQLQKNISDAGLSCGAYVEPTDKIANFQIEQTIKTSQINLKRFGSLHEAEEWLN